MRQKMDKELERIGNNTVRYARDNCPIQSDSFKECYSYRVDNGRLEVTNYARNADILEARGYDILSSASEHLRNEVECLQNRR